VRYGPGVWQHNASPAHLEEALHGSLKRLRLERIDIYQLHVPDPATSFDASVETLARLREQGKIRHVALSNVTLEHLERARKIVPIVSVQNRYSFADREWDYLLDHCEANGIAFLPWGPLAQNRKANEVVEKIAAARGVSTAVVSLAWLLRRSPVTLPIPGTGSVKHLEDNVSAAAFRLTDAEFAELGAVVPKPYWLR
jgi:aryl-alcohol dehydrogenase-like predicted oxidoreductase